LDHLSVEKNPLAEPVLSNRVRERVADEEVYQHEILGLSDGLASDVVNRERVLAGRTLAAKLAPATSSLLGFVPFGQ